MLSLIIMFFLVTFFYAFTKSNNNKSFTSIFLVSIEILSISFAIASERKKTIAKLVGYVIGGMYLIMMPFTLFGICKQYLGYEEFNENSDLIIVLSAIFYHY